MNLIQVLSLAGLFLAGAGLGAASRYVLGRWQGSVPELIGGVLVLLFCAGPLYRRLGWIPDPPPCPRCLNRRYRLVDRSVSSLRWRCAGCGHMILMQGHSGVAVDEQGNPTARLELKWPVFLGRWKSQGVSAKVREESGPVSNSHHQDF
jgi:hypothetical protein